jgi:transposase-like protein
MPGLDKAFSDFLRVHRGGRSYAALARDLGVAESTLYRLINGGQSATLGTVEKVLRKLELAPTDIFGKEAHRKRTRRG